MSILSRNPTFSLSRTTLTFHEHCNPTSCPARSLTLDLDTTTSSTHSVYMPPTASELEMQPSENKTMNQPQQSEMPGTKAGSTKPQLPETTPTTLNAAATAPALNRTSTTVDIDTDVEDVFNQLPALPSPLPARHRLFYHCKPPEAPTYTPNSYSVFLAGSIEMGSAVQWQRHAATLLSHLPITVNNPRRGHWDPNATQEAKNEEFRAQVEWELAALEKADVIAFFFDVNTKSPVTLLELGLWAHSGKVIVCCDERYWRAGNVHIVCERYGIPYVKLFAELVPRVEKMLGEKGMELDQKGDLVVKEKKEDAKA